VTLTVSGLLLTPFLSDPLQTWLQCVSAYYLGQVCFSDKSHQAHMDYGPWFIENMWNKQIASVSLQVYDGEIGLINKIIIYLC